MRACQSNSNAKYVVCQQDQARSIARAHTYTRMHANTCVSITCVLLTPSYRHCRAVVKSVQPGQPAEKAGIEVGDRIVAIGRFSINPGMLAKAMQLIKEAKGTFLLLFLACCRPLPAAVCSHICLCVPVCVCMCVCVCVCVCKNVRM